MSDRIDAQRRVEQIRAFRAELAALTAAGQSPLTAEQERTLTAYHDDVLRRLAAEYDVDRSQAEGQLSSGMQLLSFFGAVTLTAAIYSLVERFWGRFDLPLQATLLALFPIVALVGVEFAARRERTLYIASLFALVAYGSFWLAMGVLSYTLNVPFVPSFVWAGVIFGFALALPYGFRFILATALLALAVAIPAGLFSAADIEWSLIFDRIEPLTVAGLSLLLLAVPLARVHPDFPPVTRLVAFGIGLIGLLLLSVNGRMSLLPLSPDVAEAIYQAVMFIVSGAALALSIRRGWRETMRLAGAMFTLFLLTRYLDWFWELLPRYVFFLILATAAFVSLLALRRLRARLAGAR